MVDALVSIVLPTYNGARYLQEAIRSCLDQTYRHIELVVVDDCSTDSTPAVLQTTEDDRIRRVRNESNLGLPRSLNVGFSHSTGEYLTWTSDDNQYALTAVEEMLSYLKEHQDTAFVYTDYWGIDADGQVLGRAHLRPPSFLEEYNVVNACFLYRRIVYEVVGDYDPTVALSEDYDYWLRVYHHFKMAWLPKPLYYYRRHLASLTSQRGFVQQQQAAETVRRRWIGPDPYRYPTRLGRNLGRVYMDVAFEAHREERWRDRRRFLMKAIRYDPRWLTNRGVRSLLVRAMVRRLVGAENASG